PSPPAPPNGNRQSAHNLQSGCSWCFALAADANVHMQDEYQRHQNESRYGAKATKSCTYFPSPALSRASLRILKAERLRSGNGDGTSGGREASTLFSRSRAATAAGSVI